MTSVVATSSDGIVYSRERAEVNKQALLWRAWSIIVQGPVSNNHHQYTRLREVDFDHRYNASESEEGVRRASARLVDHRAGRHQSHRLHVWDA